MTTGRPYHHRLAIAIAVALVASQLPHGDHGSPAAPWLEAVHMGAAIALGATTAGPDAPPHVDVTGPADAPHPDEEHGPTCAWCSLVRWTAPEPTRIAEPAPNASRAGAAPTEEIVPERRSDPAVRSRAPPIPA